MGARDLLDDLAHAGVTVAADGENLVIRPASKLTDTMRAELRQRKAEVLALLVPRPATAPAQANTAHGQEAEELSDPDRWCWPDSDAWNTAEIDTFTARTMLFIRRGIGATQADDLAESLVIRDRAGDDRRMCLECAHLSGNAAHAWRCRSARAAGIAARDSAELPADLVMQCQRCPSFREVTP